MDIRELMLGNIVCLTKEFIEEYNEECKETPINKGYCRLASVNPGTISVVSLEEEIIDEDKAFFSVSSRDIEPIPLSDDILKELEFTVFGDYFYIGHAAVTRKPELEEVAIYCNSFHKLQQLCKLIENRDISWVVNKLYI